MKSFHVPCRLTLLLGKPDGPLPWEWPHWLDLASELDPVLAFGRAKASVRAACFTGRPLKELKFGRLGWSREDHAKWTFQSPLTENRSHEWTFSFVQVWSPAPAVCSRQGLPPDFFLQISNEDIYDRPGRSVQFNPVVLCSVRLEANEALAKAAGNALSSLALRFQPVLTATRDRQWGGAGLNINSVGEMLPSGVFVDGDRHTRPISRDILRPGWHVVAT